MHKNRRAIAPDGTRDCSNTSCRPRRLVNGGSCEGTVAFRALEIEILDWIRKGGAGVLRITFCELSGECSVPDLLEWTEVPIPTTPDDQLFYARILQR
jgi:hypothetical protein